MRKTRQQIVDFIRARTRSLMEADGTRNKLFQEAAQFLDVLELDGDEKQIVDEVRKQMAKEVCPDETL